MGVMFSREHILSAFSAAVPIMLGYVAIGLPCGILGNTIGLNPCRWRFCPSFCTRAPASCMIPNMFLAGSSVAAITASVSLVNTRQMLLRRLLRAPVRCKPRWLAALFAASVTDESYGVNTARFSPRATGRWIGRSW
ncbi:MAG: AzlC family ABC transporter permease [Adlercreutzia equolifaciens]